jgi:putative ABC transport system permease protein
MTHPDAAVERVDSIDGRLAETVRDRSFATLVLTLFAIAGLGVTATGVFAVVAFVVARRTREIAIHVAMGAEARDVRRWVMRDAVRAILLGAGAGVVAGRLLGRTLEGLLYGIEAGDGATMAIAALVMLFVAAVAAWLPTRQALRLEPTVALRSE